MPRKSSENSRRGRPAFRRRRPRRRPRPDRAHCRGGSGNGLSPVPGQVLTHRSPVHRAGRPGGRRGTIRSDGRRPVGSGRPVPDDDPADAGRQPRATRTECRQPARPRTRPLLGHGDRYWPISRQQGHTIVTRAAAAAGVYRLKPEQRDGAMVEVRTPAWPHLFRHGAATAMLEDSDDDAVFVRDQLGHRNIRETLHYAALSESKRRERQPSCGSPPRPGAEPVPATDADHLHQS